MSKVDQLNAEGTRALRAIVPGLLVLVVVAIAVLSVGGSDVLAQSAGVWFAAVVASFILSGHTYLALQRLGGGPQDRILALAFLGGSAVFLSSVVFMVAVLPTYPSTAQGHQRSVFPGWLQASVPIVLAAVTGIRLNLAKRCVA